MKAKQWLLGLMITLIFFHGVLDVRWVTNQADGSADRIYAADRGMFPDAPRYITAWQKDVPICDDRKLS